LRAILAKQSARACAILLARPAKNKKAVALKMATALSEERCLIGLNRG
jgi:hypothetical protein